MDKARLLLAYGAGINTLDGTQLSPLLTVLTTKCLAEESARYITLVRLLLAAGARIQADTLERLKVLIVYLQSSQQDKEGLFRLLMSHATKPLPLQFLCRNKIRGEVIPNADNKILLLPLPKTIINFLRFDDVLGGI